jgi:hypothetical protein
MLVRNLRRNRQLEGIADAKARGVYKGRRATINPTQIKRMKANGVGRSTIATTRQDRSCVGLLSARHVIWINDRTTAASILANKRPREGGLSMPAALHMPEIRTQRHLVRAKRSLAFIDRA